MLERAAGVHTSIDVLQARRFLRALCNTKSGDADPIIVFQCIDDLKLNRPGLTEHKAGALPQLLGYLRAQNQRGAAIFFQVNAGGRGDTFVAFPRALVLDDDLTAPVRPDLSKLPPSASVRSSFAADGRPKMHYYWFLTDGENESLETWRRTQIHFAKVFHTDATIIKLSQAMRLPGFLHCKATPQRSELLTCDAARRFTIAEVLSAFQLTNGHNGANGHHHTVEEKYARVDAALAGELPPPEKGVDGRDSDDMPHTLDSQATFQRLCDWLKRIGEPYIVKAAKPRFIFLTRGCPRNRDHKDAILIATRRGAIVGKCFHDSCFDDKTEVLTRNGFIPFACVTAETEIATRSADGRIVYHRPTARQRFMYKGKLIHFRSKSVDLCVTPDHALFTASAAGISLRRVEAELARKQSRIYFSRYADWNGSERTTYRIPSVRGKDGRCLDRRNSALNVPMDDWLALFGWYIAEGSCNKTKTNYDVVITQKSERTRSEIIEIAKRVGFHANHNTKNVRICSKQLYEHLRPFGHAADKYIPREFLQLPKRQLSILFGALMAGDGDADGQRYTTTSKQLADDIQEIALKLGIGATVTNRGRTRTGKPLFRIYLANSTKHCLTKENIHEVDYDGEVFDVTVPNHVLMVRRNGRICWSGNCGGTQTNAWKDFRNILGGWADLQRGDHVELATRLRNELRVEHQSEVVSEHGHKLAPLYRYEPKTGAWLTIGDEALCERVMTYAGLPFGEKGTPKKLNAADVQGTLQLVKIRCAQPAFFEQAPQGALFTNGFLVIRGRKLELLPHDPENRARSAYQFDYDPAATAPRWEQHLREVFQDDPRAEEKTHLLQDFFGACVLGIATRYHRSLFLTGEGSNGKSVCLKVLSALFPPSLIATIKPQDMDDDYSRAMLLNKRINIVTEVPERELFHTAGFNAMIDGSMIKARPIREAPVVFAPTAAHVFACNSLPAVKDFSRGFWRRVLVIAFNREFTEAEQDKYLPDKIIATELGGVCNWCLTGGARVLEQAGYTNTPASDESSNRWREQSDSVALFLRDETEECALPDGNTTEELFQAFRQYADENEHRRMSKEQFSQRLARIRPIIAHERKKVDSKARMIWGRRLLHNYGLLP